MLCNHVCMAATAVELSRGTGASEDGGFYMSLNVEGSLHRDCCLTLDFCFS